MMTDNNLVFRMRCVFEKVRQRRFRHALRIRGNPLRAVAVAPVSVLAIRTLCHRLLHTGCRASVDTRMWQLSRHPHEAQNRCRYATRRPFRIIMIKGQSPRADRQSSLIYTSKNRPPGSNDVCFFNIRVICAPNKLRGPHAF
jgi:hypothetical protein